MSQFIDKLNQVSQISPQSMGFRTAQSASDKPRILLIASFDQAEIDSLADRVAGADACLLHIPELSTGNKTLKEISQSVPDVPWGRWLGGIGEGEAEQLTESGCDFVVFPPAGTSLALLKDDKMGKILQVEASLSDGLLRAVDELPVDAVLATSEQEGEAFLTWQHLMSFQRCANLLTKPLLVPAPSNVSTNELEALWEIGVKGIVIGMGTRQPVGRLAELHQIISELVFPSPRQRRKAEPLLPYTSQTATVDTEEEKLHIKEQQ